jgi:phosphoribosylanthranilate isomerase
MVTLRIHLGIGKKRISNGLLKQAEYVRPRKKCQPKLSTRIFSDAMSQLIVQIYEIQTPEEAIQVLDQGVDHVGSVILSGEEWKNPALKQTINVVKRLGSKSTLIPLFQSLDLIFKALDYYQPDIIHFCDDISDNNYDFNMLLFVQKSVKEKYPDMQIMRSIPIVQSDSTETVHTIRLAQIFEPVSDFFLTDTLLTANSDSLTDPQPVSGFIGITGKTCDWNVARDLVKISRIPVILAGGITPDNVYKGIIHVRPAGVDSCTATNAKDKNGSAIRFKKDFGKIKRFVDQVRSAEQKISAVSQ